MALVQSRFKSEECRVEYGIYYSNDEIIPVTGTPQEGYVFSARSSVHVLVSKTPSDWIPIDEQCRVQDGGLLITVGGTSWEGDGFVAVQSLVTGVLVWILHV
jgi:hypothetical protein